MIDWAARGAGRKIRNPAPSSTTTIPVIAIEPNASGPTPPVIERHEQPSPTRQAPSHTAT